MNTRRLTADRSLLTEKAVEELVTTAFRQFGGRGDAGARVLRAKMRGKKQIRLSLEEYRQRPERRASRPGRAEHDAQAAVFARLRLHEKRHPELALIFAVPNGGKRGPRERAEKKAEGLKAGVSDIAVPIARRGYGGAFIEMKRPGEKARPEQLAFQEGVRQENYATKICYSVDEAVKFLNWYLRLEM